MVADTHTVNTSLHAKKFMYILAIVALESHLGSH